MLAENPFRSELFRHAAWGEGENAGHCAARLALICHNARRSGAGATLYPPPAFTRLLRRLALLMSGQSSTRGKRAGAKSTSGASMGEDGATARANSKLADRRGLIVGIGASAGGLTAFKSFLSNVPSDSGMAFVLVQHLSPDYKSMLADLLGMSTDMPVLEAEDGMAVEPNRVFVIPPDSTLTMKDRRLRLERPAPPRERRRPIDTFFSSLAEDQGENAVCIVLSGTGSDGALGLKQVKESGGLTLAQAEFDHTAMSGMPHSAAATGLVDYVLPVEEMPAKLLEYQRHLRQVSDHKDGDGTRNDTLEHLPTIIALLRIKIGHDFSKYKEKTLVRRIQRRMQVLHTDTVPSYIARLRDDPVQLELLFRELLIGVTQFFRDPEAFDVLGEAIDKIIARKSEGEELRVWVPACATGEEAYSIAILLKEAMEKKGIAFRVQIFATDIDDNAVAFARSGRYRKTTGILPERLARWFISGEEEIRPINEIREMCVFSVHSVVKDPPFSKLDLLSCRNLLIYMDADLQDRVLGAFHYALKPNGVLFLGPSEGVSRLTQFFAPLDKKRHIFQRQGASPIFPGMAFTGGARAQPSHNDGTPAILAGGDRIDKSARRAVAKYSPAYVVIDKHENIVRFSGGEAGRYLEPSAGPASLNLFSNLKKALRLAVRTALQKMILTQAPAVQNNVVIKFDGGGSRSVTVIVEPISGAAGETGLAVVAFLESGDGKDGPGAITAPESNPAEMRALENELRTVRTELQSSIDDLETTVEEMKSGAEEYQSVNEKLQSSNEELQTAKEEMQSINEELQTINAEFSAKNDALTSLNSDVKNLLDSTQIAIMFLDNTLRIKNFTPAMTAVFPLRDSDRGRPVTEIVSLLAYDDIAEDVTKALRDLATVEREVKLKAGDAAYLLRIRPYRTIDNVIDGVVMTFVDITERKKSHEQKSLLLAELDHRVRNILAIVSSVIGQTLKTTPSPAAFAGAMEGRIVAISRAHSVLTQSGREVGASLRELLTTELAPYDRGGKSLSITGVDLLMTPRAGLSLAMAFHELESNAVKYGALSTDTGALSVSWTVSHKSPPILHFVWSETGGPPIAEAPSQRGFGSTLIERTLAHEMDAVVRQEFRSAGLHCTIDIPLTDDVGYAQGFVH
jgi:two-component system, chemotaxis family, CheB/CheR fusion protein